MLKARSCVVLLTLFFLNLSALGQHKKTVVKNVTKHANGELHENATITTIYSKNPDILDFYWKKIYETQVYDSTGNMIYELERVTKRGTYGKPCHEILYHYVQYDSNGEKLWEQESKCDCKHQTIKKYQFGKLIVKEKKRRFSWQ